MKTILIPTDFSDCAKNAMRYAVAKFGVDDVKYMFLNTFQQPPAGAGSLVSIVDILSSESKEGLKKDCAYFEGLILNTDAPVDFISEYGELSRVITEETKNNHIDHVVMGTNGSEGIDKFFSGSNAANLIRASKCPLWIIPNTSEYKNIKIIGFAADFDQLQNENILDPVKNLLAESEAELIVVNVQEERNELDLEQGVNRMKLGHSLNGLQHFVYNAENSNVIEGIENFCEEYTTDLLVMVARKHGFFESIFRKSITKQLAMLAKTPLLILNE